MNTSVSPNEIQYIVNSTTWVGSVEFRNLPLISWLVGPNGSGKTFALANMAPQLQKHLVEKHNEDNRRPIKVAYIKVSRTSSLIDSTIHRGTIEQLSSQQDIVGVVETTFNTSIGRLASKPALRIRVQATLEARLGRKINMRFDQGQLEFSMESTSATYSHQQEARGILEFIHHLSVLYDESFGGFVFDEPELSLHPQRQMWLLDEIRKLNKPCIIATHSPAMLDVRNIEDLRGVICFHGDGRPPTQISDLTLDNFRLTRLLPRLTADSNAFYFTTNPLFCEGYQDAVLFSEVIRSLGLGLAMVGNPIAAGGKDSVVQALELAHALGKKPFAIVDLDAIFDERLTQYGLNIPACKASLIKMGKADFVELRKSLTDHLDKLLPLITIEKCNRLTTELQKHKEAPGKRRLLLETVARNDETLQSHEFKNSRELIQGAFKTMCDLLEEANIFVLPLGELEHHLPGFSGDPFNVSDKDKPNTLDAELEWLKPITRKKEEVRKRYPQLVAIFDKLPLGSSVDVLPILKIELSNMLHIIVQSISLRSVTEITHISSAFSHDKWKELSQIFTCNSLTVESPQYFFGEFEILDKYGIGSFQCKFDNQTKTSDPNSLTFTPVENIREMS